MTTPAFGHPSGGGELPPHNLTHEQRLFGAQLVLYYSKAAFSAARSFKTPRKALFYSDSKGIERN